MNVENEENWEKWRKRTQRNKGRKMQRTQGWKIEDADEIWKRKQNPFEKGSYIFVCWLKNWLD